MHLHLLIYLLTGTNDIQVVTMFAHAKKGEVNYSNNPTFLQYGQTQLDLHLLLFMKKIHLENI